jgi:hypothetical protein
VTGTIADRVVTATTVDRVVKAAATAFAPTVGRASKPHPLPALKETPNERRS